MIAKDFKQLIATIPDGDRIAHCFFNHSDEEQQWDYICRIGKFLQPKIQARKSYNNIWILSDENSLPKFDDLITEQDLQESISWAELKNSFPATNCWIIADGWNKKSFDVKFSVGYFELKYTINKGRETKMTCYISGKKEDFDTWEQFFEKATPEMKKCAQKQRESLETLLD